MSNKLQNNFITIFYFLLAIFSLFFHFQLFQSLVIWNSFVRINGTIWYLSIHVWTTLMLSQAKLDIWLPRVYRDDGDCAGDNFLERDHQHHCHDQHLAPECSPRLTHQTSYGSSHKSSFPPSSVEWLSMIGDENYLEIANLLVIGFVFPIVFCLCISICISICVLFYSVSPKSD